MSGRPWSESDLKRLTDMWGVHPPEKLGRILGRTLQSIRVRGSKIGLRSSDAKVGYESAEEAAKRHGVGVQWIRTSLRLHGAHTFRIYTSTPILRRRGNLRAVYDKCTVDDAVASRKTLETMAEAGIRLGVVPKSLLQWVNFLGLTVIRLGNTGRKRYFAHASTWDKAFQWWQDAETAGEAAERFCVGFNTMTRILRASGAKQYSAAQWLLQPRDVDRAVYKFVGWDYDVMAAPPVVVPKPKPVAPPKKLNRTYIYEPGHRIDGWVIQSVGRNEKGRLVTATCSGCGVVKTRRPDAFQGSAGCIKCHMKKNRIPRFVIKRSIAA